MKKSLYFVFALMVAVFTGCSDISEDIVTVKAPGIHGTGVNDTSSSEFHGFLKGAKFTDCQRCHGGNYQGGSANASCIKCHPTVSVHTKDILVPASSAFHGKFIAANNWNMLDCRKCHGVAYTGGRNNASCATSGCHTKPKGPEDCATCHGTGTLGAPAPAINGDTTTTYRGVGAHKAHLVSAVNAPVISCNNCHVVPASFDAAGHVGDGGERAELIYSGLAKTETNKTGTANYTSTLPRYTPTPTYNFTTLTCQNTYCHGSFKNGRLTNTVSWNTGEKMMCGSCHGDGSKNPMPKLSGQGGSHPNVANCSFCHSEVVSVTVVGSDTTYTIIDKTKHINGKLNVGGQEIDY